MIQFGVVDISAAGMFRQPVLDALQSPALFSSVTVLTLLNGLQFALGGIAGLVLLRLVVRRTPVAVAMLVALTIPLSAGSGSASDVLFAAARGLFGLAVLLRVGVLANVVMLIAVQLLTSLPLTLDADAWYFGRSLIVLSMIGALATCGFIVALAGRPAFGVLARES